MSEEIKSKVDTHSYKGWLNSDSFIKRSLAIFGYNTVGSFIVLIPFYILIFALVIAIIGFSGVTDEFSEKGYVDQKNNTYMMEEGYRGTDSQNFSY
jgi:hypothetical protein